MGREGADGDETKKRAKRLFEEFEEHREQITLLLKTQVLGTLDDQGALALLNSGQKLERMKPSRLIISTGCHERAQPFPGWTLTGVMTVGDAHLHLLLGHRPRDGARDLPLLLFGQQPLRPRGSVPSPHHPPPPGAAFRLSYALKENEGENLNPISQEL